MKSIIWLIPTLPLAAAFLNGFIALTFLRSKPKSELTATQRGLRYLTSTIGILAIAAALLVSLIVLFFLIGQDKEHKLIQVENIYTWIPSGDFNIKVGFNVDPLTSMMTVVVTTISLLVHIFSTGYMREESGYHRFYTYLPFFTFSMLGLILVNNFLLLYVFWEAVGLSSYLLIGYWFSKKYDWGRLLPSDASKKAFIVNRVGDFGFGLGIMWIFVVMLNHAEGAAKGFDRLNYQNVFQVFEEGSKTGAIDHNTITIIAILLFMGAMGKSAQMPLQVWLPDAMAGPTPVSALIHAATMVTAGVYMVGRVNPIFSLSPEAMTFVAVIGILTAFFGSTVGTTQKDIKAVMAYSTVSQLGYMFFALGVLGWVAAFFHLMTHAFFKGLLFLGCGSIIHSNEETIHEALHKMHLVVKDHNLAEEIEHAIHHDVDPQDMDNMGQLIKKMPLTGWSMVVGAAALAGVPFTAGFWSKDEILGQAFAHGQYPIYIVGLFAALLTAFYSFRMIFSVFFSGDYRLPKAMNRAVARAGGVNAVEFVAQGRKTKPNQVEVIAKESTKNMTFPLVFLGFMSIAAGYVGLPRSIFGGLSVFDSFLEATFEPAFAQVAPKETSAWLTVILLILSGAIALTGVAIAYYMYHQNRDVAPYRARRIAGPLYTISKNKWYFDEAYDLLLVKSGLLFERSLWLFDRYVIDGAVNGTGWVTRQSANYLRKVQTGFVGNYALYITIGLVGVIGLFYLINGI
ncbi:MAG: NADH-quinone oxidoreductase subunit L [Chloroflexi bacterium]|nr:NADH-quinone oxidoreductase subunit L [Chloroflexota bacterium]